MVGELSGATQLNWQSQLESSTLSISIPPITSIVIHELPRLGDLVAWDAPEHYGVACKRIDSREPHTKSVSTANARCPRLCRR